jgi:hypothetical protein
MIPTMTASHATPARCVMCGAPASRARPANAVLCDSPFCRSRHAALPPSQRCRACSRPIAVSQWAAGHCDQPDCRDEILVRRPLAAAKAAYAALVASAPKHRNRSAARRGIPPEERESYRLTILPLNSDQSAELSPARRAAFEAHLRGTIVKARARLAAGEVPPPEAPFNPPPAGDERSDAEREAERQLVGAGCARCRGRCCMLGADHAFNGPETMMRYLERYPTHDDETIVARYLSYLAPRTLQNGCVYQHEHGCTLPRDLRADICNRFYCSDINVIRNAFAAGDPVRAYFVHVDGGRFIGGQFVDIPVAGE